MSSPHYVLVNTNYHELRVSYLVTNSFYSPLSGTWGGGENLYVGFTPHANILHSYGALCLNAIVVVDKAP